MSEMQKPFEAIQLSHPYIYREGSIREQPKVKQNKWRGN